jgi:hypothetical protein
VLANVSNFAAATATIFGAFVFAAIKAFFLLFCSETIHCFCVWDCGGSPWRFYVSAAAAEGLCARAF